MDRRNHHLVQTHRIVERHRQQQREALDGFILMAVAITLASSVPIIQVIRSFV